MGLRNILSRLVISSLLLLGGTQAKAQAESTPNTIPPDHWAYQTVQSLARRGLIYGYPPDGDFLGGRAITRYEFATLLQRVLRTYLPSSKTSDSTLTSNTPQPTELISTYNNLLKLLAEHRETLRTLGTDAKTIEQARAALVTQRDRLEAQLKRTDSSLQAIEKRAIGVAQKNDTAFGELQATKTKTHGYLAQKVDTKADKLRVGATIAVWYLSSFGDSAGGNLESNFGQPAEGRNFGGGVGDTYRLRYGNVSFSGEIHPRTNYRVMLNLADVNSGSEMIKDLWVGYRLSNQWRVEIGRQVTGLSVEGSRSDGSLFTLERAIMNSDIPAVSGRIGNIRDNGLVFRYQAGKLDAQFGLWNGNGEAPVNADNNRSKFVTGAMYFRALRHFTLGIWGGTNISGNRGKEIRDRAGGTFIFDGGSHIFQIEGAYAKDREINESPKVRGAISSGFYILYGYKISKKWEVLIRYDIWDPSQNDISDGLTGSGIVIPQGDHKLKEYTFGINYFPYGSGTKIQFNLIRDDPEKNGKGYFGKPRWIAIMGVVLAI